jgi:hypothetical protein
MKRLGPSRRRVLDASAALRIFGRHPEKTFSTISSEKQTSLLLDLRLAAAGAKRPFASKQHATTSELVDFYAVGGDGGCGQQERQSSGNPKSRLLAQRRRAEADAGPVRYLAELMGIPATDLERSVRLLTLALVAVLDPMAVLLLLAAGIHTTRADSRRLFAKVCKR